jgi:membrane-bound lytic murein transglycosylase A
MALPLLPGWAEEDHVAALRAFRETCSRDPGLAVPCAEARTVPSSREAARRFFEAQFVAQPVGDGAAGLLTAYFSPEYPARRAPDAEFSAPLRARPADLLTVDGGQLDPAQAGRRVGARQVDGRLEPYPARAEIERRAPEALAWLRPEDLFFLQIQGSGALAFPDGSRLRAVYAGDNGRPFVGIARVMRERGLLADNQTSGDVIRRWLAEHRGAEAQAVMNENPRYVFFALQPDDGREPAGAAGLPLPAGRAVAIDPTHHDYGGVMWIDARAPALAGAFPAYRRLVMALDTGGAIKGPVRADLYLGRGDRAGAEAGRVRHELRMFRLVPRA